MISKLITRIALSLITISVVLVGYGGYLGFVPYVNTLFGSDKPRDLGIKFAPADTVKVQDKIGVKLVALPKDTPVTESIKLKGKKNASYSLTSEELSALANNRPWKYYPLENVQVKINSDTTVEVSGLLNTAKLSGYAEAIGFDAAKPKELLTKYHIQLTKLPFYVKVSGGVSDGDVKLDIQKAEVGRLGISQDLVEQAEKPVEAFIETFMSKASGFYAERLEFNSSRFIFEGTVPEEEATVNN